eukprot:m.32882 g.32882  ORF g.32882 m.32882 type:complete len:82 (+) comp10952_c0_seq1:63-308(+)
MPLHQGLALGRTVLVGRRPLDAALKVLNKAMNRDGLINQVRSKRRFETPTLKREREEAEACVGIYKRELKKKIQLYFESKV